MLEIEVMSCKIVSVTDADFKTTTFRWYEDYIDTDEIISIVEAHVEI